MNGLRALMPQTPKKERTDAAMGIAGMAMENQNIPPELKHAVEVKKAQDILQAADSQLAMERGQMQQPPQVVPRMRQQVNQRLQGQTMQGGLMDTLRSLRAGAQMRGGQSKRAMARKALGPMTPSRAPAGLAGIPSPNMASMANPRRAAQGGIMGFASGGMEQDARPTPDGKPNSAAQDAEKVEIDNYIQMYKAYKASLAGAATAEEKQQVESRFKEFQQGFDPNTRAKAHQKMDQVGGLEAIKGLAPGGAVSSALPANATPEQLDAFYGDQPMPLKPQEGATDAEQLLLDRALEQVNRDAVAEGRAAGDRLRELTELTEERALLEQAQDAVRDAMSARLTPEQESRRKRRAAFRGMSEGLGGASRRIGEEEEAIQAERVGIAQTSVADYQKLVDSLEARGMSQAEAERAVQAQVQSDMRQGLSTAQSITQQLRQAETTRRGQDIQLEVAKEYAARQPTPTDQENFARDYLDKLRAEGDNRTDAEILTEGRVQYRQLAASYGYAGRELAEFGDVFKDARDAALAEIELLSDIANTTQKSIDFKKLTPDQAEAYKQKLIDDYIRDYRRSVSSVGSSGSNSDRPPMTDFGDPIGGASASN